MFMPTIFHENLFDDFFDPFWNDGALERAMNREERETFGKRGANMMKTDVKQTADGNYDVAVDLPGCKKEYVESPSISSPSSPNGSSFTDSPSATFSTVCGTSAAYTNCSTPLLVNTSSAHSNPAKRQMLLPRKYQSHRQYQPH